jgi:myo-inositol-1(or 4)-monophosphatase
MTALDERFETASRLIAEAAGIALRLRPPPGVRIGTLKGRQDWLSEADGAVERFLSDSLLAAFPEDGFQGEEGGIARVGRLRWVVDPIDGTANYVRGSPRFCVSLALLEDRTPLIGLLEAPAVGESFSAMRGAGATLNGTPIRAADTTDLDRALIEVGYSARVPFADFAVLINKVGATGAMPRDGGSGALGLADVAAGRVDAYVELSINLWDCAAALAILKEADAACSPFLEDGGAEHARPILACAPGLAATLGRTLGFVAQAG